MLPLGVDPTFVVIASGLLIGLGAGPVLAIATQDLKPEERALAMSIFYSILYISVAIGPAIAGFARDLTHQPEMPFFVATVLSGLGALALAAHGLWKRPATISKVDPIGRGNQAMEDPPWGNDK
jgi:MFS family permease